LPLLKPNGLPIALEFDIALIFDYLERLLGADRFQAPPPEFARHVFNLNDWHSRARHRCVSDT